MNTNKKTDATKKTSPLDRLQMTIYAAQALAKKYRDMADEIAYATHKVDRDNDERREIDALIQKIVNATGGTNGSVISDLIDAYERGGR